MDILICAMLAGRWDANGTDEAMFRRYNRWQSRFDQPDPYDGSYSLTNPQSFNRYAYVNGDPANFVDPTGLDLIDIGNAGEVTVYGSFIYGFFSGGGENEFQGANPWADALPKRLWRPERPDPQNNGPAHTPDACGDMADNAQNIANEKLFGNSDAKGALKAFDSTFTTAYAGRAATSAIAAGRQFLNRGAGATINRYYQGESGFRSEFRDTGSHGAGQFVDQTHHLAFYISMGINENGSGALWAAQRAHRLQDNDGDARLGKAGYGMGTGLRDNPGSLINIGDMIRSIICDPNRNPAHN